MKRLLWRFHHATSLMMKLFIPGLLVIIVLFTIIAVVIDRVMVREITRQYEERARAMALFLDHEIATDRDGDAVGIAAQHIDSLIDVYPDVYRLTVYARADGGYGVIASSDLARIGAKADPHDIEPLTTGVPAVVEVTSGGRRVLELNYPLHQRGQPIAVLGVYMSLAERDLKLAAIRRLILMIAALALLIVLGLSYAITRAAIVGPLYKLLESAEGVASGNLASDIPLGMGEVPRPGVRFEITRFALAFRTMVDQLRYDREAFHELSIRDPLTGLHNRRYFDEIIQRELARADRYRYPFAIAIVDINWMREVNNLFGHLAGDVLLQQIGEFLRRNVRAADEVIRWGGDEFLILMPHTNAAEAAEVMERLTTALRQRDPRRSDQPQLSIGVASWEPGKDLESILREADAAMYEAKPRTSAQPPW